MSSPQFEALYHEHLSYVTRLARKLSKRDSDLASDLSQEAWLALLQLPEARRAESAYVRIALKHAMLRWLARERAAQVIQPEQHLHRPLRPRKRLLELRRHTPRVYIHAEPKVIPLYPRRAA